MNVVVGLWELEGAYHGMPEGEPEMDAAEGTISGCSSHEWMPKPDVDAPQEQGLNDRTNGEDE